MRPAAVDRRATRQGRGLSLHTSAATPKVAHLRLTSDDLRPDADQLHALVEHARHDPTLTTVRTSALFPSAVAPFLAAGFTTVSRLALLRAELDAVAASPGGRRSTAAAATNDGTRVVAVRRRELAQLADIDEAAFGPGWNHGTDDLRAVCAATPAHRVAGMTTAGRFSRHRPLVAFAIAGATATNGYLQRLSVHPDHHRQGHGAALTLDALRWMRARRLRACLVNTGIDNTAALALYAALGFRRLDDELQVMELDLRTPSTTASDARVPT